MMGPRLVTIVWPKIRTDRLLACWIDYGDRYRLLIVACPISCCKLVAPAAVQFALLARTESDGKTSMAN